MCHVVRIRGCECVSACAPECVLLFRDRALGAAAYASMMRAMSVRRHTQVLAIGEGSLRRTRVGVSPEQRSIATLSSFSAALLCTCECECQWYVTVALSVSCFSERHNFCSSRADAGGRYPECLFVPLHVRVR